VLSYNLFCKEKEVGMKKNWVFIGVLALLMVLGGDFLTQPIEAQ